jgi:hypothetical protein
MNNKMEKLSRKWRTRRLREMMMYLGRYSNCLEKMVANYMTQLINNIHYTGEWPKDFTEVTMLALKKKS